MKKIGIFYSTNSGKTEAIAEEIEFNVRKLGCELINIKNGIEKIEEFSNLILITPTYNVGEPQKYWMDNLDKLKAMDFKGKKVGLVGLGNQFAFGESFVSGIRVLYDIVKENGAEVIGFTSTKGYKFEDSAAVIGDEFVGLALDENNQDDETPDKIYEWVESIKENFNK